MSLSIREMTEADFESADVVLRAAFGTPDSRIADLRRYSGLQPDGWFVAEVDGKIAGTVGAVIFGSFAYIGLMAVAPAMQRRGIARALMRHVLAWIAARGCATALLDASKSGAPLYAGLGFAPADQAFVFQRDTTTRLMNQPPRVEQLRVEDIPALVEFDTPIYGAARAALFQRFLAEFRDRAFITRDADGCVTGFAIAQPRRIGPWVARNARDAEALLQAALMLDYDGAASVLLPSPNTGANEFLERYGFQFERAQTHMWRGEAYPARQRALIYGQASFMVG
ncbi:MAG: GNAT family N-acetyltransferase [Chloroflexota bacterium]